MFTTRPFSAASVGCIGHLLAFMVSGGALGMFGIFFLPMILGAFTTLTLLVAFFAGPLLYLPAARRFWSRSPRPALTLLLVGASLFALGLWSTGKLPPLDLPETDPDTQDPAELGHTTYPGLLLTVFAVLHWPSRTDKPPASFRSS